MSQEPLLDFSKLFCSLHPYELMTNFCNDEKCLIGLCATCICTHTQMHGQLGTVPHYQNIRDTFASLHNQARKQVNLIEEDKCKLGSIRQAIEVKKITIRKTIKQLKEDTISKVKQEFESLQKKIMTDIISEEKKQGYHSNNRLQTLSSNLSKQTEILLSYIEGLNSPHFLAWAKKLKKQSLMETNLTRQKIQKQLQENETYTANLKWNQNFLSDLQNSIKRLFTLQFIIPKATPELKIVQIPFKNCSLNTSSFSRSSSQPKHSLCLTRTNSLSGLSKFAQSTSYSNFFNDTQKNNKSHLQRQSLLKKNSLNVSEISNIDLSSSKENFMTQSSYMPQSELNKKSIAFNKFSPLSKTNSATDKLSNLIEAKRNSNFDNPSDIIVGEENQRFQDSRIRFY